jgi:hypothetical protein
VKLSMRDEQALTELATILYPYLPASGAVYTFGEAAGEAGVGDLWPGVKGTGLSKLPALTELLSSTLTLRRHRFCALVEQIVRAGLRYRRKKGRPVTRSDITCLNDVVALLGFKIPELWDPEFLGSLPAGTAEQQAEVAAPASTAAPLVAAATLQRRLDKLREEFLTLHTTRNRQDAGLRLEQLLARLFDVFGLMPTQGFRVFGEQIDGALQLEGAVYLLEAKWTAGKTDEAALLVFRGKIEGKSQFTRGLFISVSGYTEEALQAITRGKSPNFVMLDGSHLFRVLEGHVRLDALLVRTVRHLAETGEPYLPVSRL